MSENPAQPFPDDPALGKFRAIYTTNRLSLLLKGGLIYAGLVLILQILFANADDATTNVLFIAYPAIALGVFWVLAHQWNRAVVLYERGFTYRRGSQIGLFRYDAIVTLRLKAIRVRLVGILRRDQYQLTLISGFDEVMTIDNSYTEPAKLTATLENAITKARLPIIHAQLARGERVPFGAVWVSKDGIEWQDATLKWGDYVGYAAQEGHMVFHDWQSVPLESIDNALLLAHLLKERTPKA